MRMTNLVGCCHESCRNISDRDFAVTIFEHHVFIGILLRTEIHVVFVEQVIDIFVVDLVEEER